jgi:DNA polymerase III subunit alpha
VDVTEDGIMLVKARVTKRDDRISLIVGDLTVPELSQSAGPYRAGEAGT